MAKLANELMLEIQKGVYDEILTSMYVDESLLPAQKERYIEAIKAFTELFGEKEIEIYSAPGRSEIGGNHTDHQYGKVMATSVNIDTIAVVAKAEDMTVRLKSEGYPQMEVDLSDLAIVPEEEGTTKALIRGVAAGMKEKGCEIGGFYAYATSQVLSGSGLSSSAAFEVLIGNIISGSYNDGKMDAVTIAQIGQMAENVYFGKPSGLMDQMACSVGGLIHIDFADRKEPIVDQVRVNFKDFAHSLCIIDTKGSHANLTDDYAEIPAEMKKVAGYFEKEVLREVEEDAFYKALNEIRTVAGDRAVLRSIHFFDDNKRVDQQKEALLEGDFEAFKKLILSSGESSYKYLQNVYSIHKPKEESVALALLLVSRILGEEGAWRVHGGGFAGTIQAFVPNDLVAEFKRQIESFFGEGACYVLQVRPYGGMKVM